jgi:hypothetical protein
MLASLGSQVIHQAAEIPEQLPLLVQLPPEMSNFFIESGYLEAVYGELRGQSRLRVRCPAILRSDFVPPFMKRAKRLAKVLIKDMSRSGLGILSHEQLWPGETFWIELCDRNLHIRVVRCRKIADSCYEVGGLVMCVN